MRKKRPVGFDTLTIEFEGRPEKVVTQQSPVTLNEYFTVREAYAAALWDDRASVEAAYATFEPFIVSWDFPQPTTAKGMADLDVVLAMTIIGTWVEEVRNVPRPLARRSSAGAPSPEE